jgi:hypothetical protein
MRSPNNMTMKRFFQTSAIAIALAFALATSIVPASALAPKDAVVECDLNGLLQELAQIKQDASTSTEAAELDLRKQILTRSMECNAREATALAATVGALDGNTRVSQALKKRYETALGNAAAYATDQGARAATLQTVSSTKEQAIALKTWRNETYNSLVWEASQLVVLDRNVKLAQSAGTRLTELHRGVAEVADMEGAEEVRAELRQASGLINDSGKKLDEALVLLRDTPKASQEAITAAQKAGLDGLSQAYRFLLEGNTKLSAIVPAE